MHPGHRTYRRGGMTQAIEQSLAVAEAALDMGEGLAGTGFWGAVRRVKTDQELVDRYADRIADIDSAAFERWALVTVPLRVGTTLMLLGTAVGLVLIGAAYALDGFFAVAVFYVGMVVLLTTTHGLGHLLVGRLVGIGFTRWFIGSWAMPQPGVKVDYSTYLRASPRRRAWMHASGALVTKAVPFALLGAAVAAGLPAWSVWALAGLGGFMVATDVAWSTKSSDWKKFKREMEFTQSS